MKLIFEKNSDKEYVNKLINAVGKPTNVEWDDEENGWSLNYRYPVSVRDLEKYSLRHIPQYIKAQEVWEKLASVCEQNNIPIYNGGVLLPEQDDRRKRFTAFVTVPPSTNDLEKGTIANESFSLSRCRGELKESYGDLSDYLERHLDSWYGRLNELGDAIEDLGLDVDEINNEYVIVHATEPDGEDVYCKIWLGGTPRTISLETFEMLESVRRSKMF